MELVRVVYISSLAAHVEPAEICEIVERSRARNAQADLTGMLLIHGGSIIQVIEGPEHAVEDLMTRIERDDRHRGMIELLREHSTERLYGDWSMGLIDTRVLSTKEQRFVSDGIGALSPSSATRAETLLRSFAANAR